MVPLSVKPVRQFLGLTGYRRFVHVYAKHAEPLFALTKKVTPFSWDGRLQEAMDLSKGFITTAPVLSFPVFHILSSSILMQVTRALGQH